MSISDYTIPDDATIRIRRYVPPVTHSPAGFRLETHYWGVFVNDDIDPIQMHPTLKGLFDNGPWIANAVVAHLGGNYLPRD